MSQICYVIIASLLKKNNHIRGLAKDLSINQMTISRRIKELEQKNVVDFRQEGKNKVYFLKESLEAGEHIKILEHIKLINIVSKDPRIRRITQEINKENKVKLAILFGSYAKDLQTKKSDIDIYIETVHPELKKKIQLIDSKVNIKIGSFDKNNLLIKEIIKNHIIIKGVERYYELIY